MADRRLYSLDEAMEYLGGITKPTLYELINQENVQRVKIGRRSFITRESLDQYIERQIQESPHIPSMHKAILNRHNTLMESNETVAHWFFRHWSRFTKQDGKTHWSLPDDWEERVISTVNYGIPIPVLAFIVTSNLALYDDGPAAFNEIISQAVSCDVEVGP